MSANPITIQTVKVESDLEKVPTALTATTTAKPPGAAARQGTPLYRVVRITSANPVLDLGNTLEPEVELTQVAIGYLWRQGRVLDTANLFKAPHHSAATTQISEKNLAQLASEIVRLVTGNEEDRPTEYAYMNALRIVSSAYTLANLQSPVEYNRIPIPVVSTDDVGGIRLSWRWRDRQVRANFGARQDLRSYLYFESRDLHDIERLEGETLAQRLCWLTSE